MLCFCFALLELANPAARYLPKRAPPRGRIGGWLAFFLCPLTGKGGREGVKSNSNYGWPLLVGPSSAAVPPSSWAGRQHDWTEVDYLRTCCVTILIRLLQAGGGTKES